MAVDLSAMKDCGRDTHIHPELTLLPLDSNNMAVALLSIGRKKKLFLSIKFKVGQRRNKEVK